MALYVYVTSGAFSIVVQNKTLFHGLFLRHLSCEPNSVLLFVVAKIMLKFHYQPSPVVIVTRDHFGNLLGRCLSSAHTVIVSCRRFHLNSLFVPREGTSVTGMLRDNLVQRFAGRDDAALRRVLLG